MLDSRHGIALLEKQKVTYRASFLKIQKVHSHSIPSAVLLAMFQNIKKQIILFVN